MQRTEIIDINELFQLIELIMSNEEVHFYESYSEMEKELIQINNYSEFTDYYQDSISKNIKHLGFAIYYPASKGSFSIDKIKLNPKHCNGKNYRYNINGWGLIFMHLDLNNPDNGIECRISVNSKKRAINWKATYPRFGNPELWNWKIVESKARKIITRLKKLHTTRSKIRY